MFSVHTETQSSHVFKFLRFEERFWKTPLAWRIGVDGRPNRRSKTPLLYFSGVAWTGSPVAKYQMQMEISTNKVVFWGFYMKLGWCSQQWNCCSLRNEFFSHRISNVSEHQYDRLKKRRILVGMVGTIKRFIFSSVFAALKNLWHYGALWESQSF